RGLHVGAQGNYVLTLSAQDSVTLDVSAQQAWSSLGNRLTSLIGNTLWTHKFDGHTSSTLGAGLSNTRFSRDDGLIAYSVFPTFAASIDHTRRLWRGQLGLNLGLFSNPVMDTLRATIDPRIGASSSISYAQGKFSSSLNGTAAISVAPEVNNTGAFDTYTASLNCAYDFVDEAGVTAGARMMKQQFQGTDLIPLSYAVFLGLRLGYARKLNGL
ncbi:MAG TPA: hypothetical protein VJN18_23400, partial [Polyangiaceae bacterium]|nr:hypothetical protein [Polyangiaceae bacterium]